jgi:hypothetical protein
LYTSFPAFFAIIRQKTATGGPSLLLPYCGRPLGKRYTGFIWKTLLYHCFQYYYEAWPAFSQYIFTKLFRQFSRIFSRQNVTERTGWRQSEIKPCR